MRRSVTDRSRTQITICSATLAQGRYANLKLPATRVGTARPHTESAAPSPKGSSSLEPGRLVNASVRGVDDEKIDFGFLSCGSPNPGLKRACRLLQPLCLWGQPLGFWEQRCPDAEQN